MKGMKRYIFMAIFAAALISCSDEISVTPAVSLFSDKPEVSDETAIFRLAAAFMPDSTEMVFPVTFGGTAERDIDYTASADAFVLGGESPVDSIVITTIRFGTEKTLNLTVDLPEGTDGGKYLTSGFTLQDYPAYITFSRDFGILADSAAVAFTLTDREGKSKVLNKDTEISLILDKDRSTAVEGTDFLIQGGTKLTIAAGKSSGRIKLIRPDEMPVSGNEKIFFKMSHDEKYGTGEFSEMELSIMENRWSGLHGKWNIDTLITDSLSMREYWGDTYTGMEFYPKQGLYDYMEFDMTTCGFMPSFFSRMKNYFLGDSYFRNGPEIEMDFGDGTAGDVQTFLIGNTNRYFSEDLMSEDDKSYIGLRLLEGPTDTLSLYVIDYTSKSFMPELEAENKYAPEKPVAASPGLFINLRFTREE